MGIISIRNAHNNGDRALRGFLKRLAGDISKGRTVMDLPSDLQRALRKALKQGKTDLDASIEGEVTL